MSEIPTLEVRVAAAHDIAKKWKVDSTLEHGREHPMPFVTVGFRGAHQLAILFPMNRDAMLTAVRIALLGFNCDVVTATIDAYGVSIWQDASDNARMPWPPAVREQLRAGLNPDTGQRWRAGEMEKAFNAHRPWIYEGLQTYGMDRVTQRIVGRDSVYRVKQRRVRWQEDRTLNPDEEDQNMTGLVPNALRASLHGFDLDFIGANIYGRPDWHAEYGLTAQEAAAHRDVVCIRMLAAEKITCAYVPPDEVTKNIVDESLNDAERNAAMGAPDLHVEHRGGTDD